MSDHVSDTPGILKLRSPEEQGIKVVLCCVACNKALANTYVHPEKDRVYVGKLSLFDGAGVEDAGGGGYRFHCTRKRCPVGTFTMPGYTIGQLAKRRAGSPRDDSGGRSIRIGPG
jgi:hypothetical protein